jgi:hypothetical protein
MMTRAMFERFVIALMMIAFLLFGLIVTGTIGKARSQYKPDYLPLQKEIQYVIMTADEYKELTENKCK